jgi:hypothetical protein
VREGHRRSKEGGHLPPISRSSENLPIQLFHLITVNTGCSTHQLFLTLYSKLFLSWPSLSFTNYPFLLFPSRMPRISVNKFRAIDRSRMYVSQILYLSFDVSQIRSPRNFSGLFFCHCITLGIMKASTVIFSRMPGGS